MSENLFLIEFIVDQIDLNRKCSCTETSGVLCTSFEFLNNEPIEVEEIDRQQSTERLYNGVSCLFALPLERVAELRHNFDIIINVHRKTANGRVIIGRALLSIASIFNHLIGECVKSKFFKDLFYLTDNKGRKVGNIDLFVRIYDLGRLIVTKF